MVLKVTVAIYLYEFVYEIITNRYIDEGLAAFVPIFLPYHDITKYGNICFVQHEQCVS